MMVEKKLSVFPNPSTEYIDIVIDDKEKKDVERIRILDLTGRELIAGKYSFHDLGNGERSFRVPVSSLADGYYILEFESGDAKYASPFVVKH
jgi:hypothetical protein